MDEREKALRILGGEYLIKCEFCDKECWMETMPEMYWCGDCIYKFRLRKDPEWEGEIWAVEEGKLKTRLK